MAVWIADRCHEEHAARTQAGVLYQSYKEWAEAAGERLMSQKRFSMELESRDYPKERLTDGVYFSGLRL